VAVVTASTAGIGLGIVRRLAAEVGIWQSAGVTLTVDVTCCRPMSNPTVPRSHFPSPTAPPQGARVVVSSRKQQSVDEAVAQLRSEGHNVAGTACHVGDPAALQRLVQFAVDTYGGGIDILVSNAAVNPAAGPILDMEVRAAVRLTVQGQCLVGGLVGRAARDSAAWPPRPKM